MICVRNSVLWEMNRVVEFYPSFLLGNVFVSKPVSFFLGSKKGEWEILEGLKEGQRFDLVPQKFEGFLLKRRKWPLKGWHKVRKLFHKQISLSICMNKENFILCTLDTLNLVYI